jgi:hypothetical protein
MLSEGVLMCFFCYFLAEERSDSQEMMHISPSYESKATNFNRPKSFDSNNNEDKSIEYNYENYEYEEPEVVTNTRKPTSSYNNNNKIQSSVFSPTRIPNRTPTKFSPTIEATEATTTEAINEVVSIKQKLARERDPMKIRDLMMQLKEAVDKQDSTNNNDNGNDNDNAYVRMPTKVTKVSEGPSQPLKTWNPRASTTNTKVQTSNLEYDDDYDEDYDEDYEDDYDDDTDSMLSPLGIDPPGTYVSYSTLLDATRRYPTLLDATRRYSTLLDATRRFQVYF